MIKGVIFDADGTLLDSMPIWHDVSRIYLEKRGLPAPQSLVDEVFTMTLAEGCAYIKSLYGLPDPTEVMEAEITDEIRGFYRDRVPLKPGFDRFLHRLYDRDVPMVIATAGLRETLTSALTRLGVAGLFREFFICGELGMTKREPFIFNHIAKKLGASPSEIFVFEDALYSIRTARAAGFRVVGVADAEQAKNEDLIAAETELLIRTPDDLDAFFPLLGS